MSPDVSYYVKKHQGFPGVTDKGVMDVIIGGQGLSFKVAMETADSKDQHHFFKVNKVDVSIKNMNIILKQSNHKLLFKLFKPLLLKVMNPLVQKAVEKQVRDSITQLDALLYSIQQEANKAKEQVKNDPESAPNVYQRYTQAAQARMTKAKAKKDEVTADKQVNMAVTQHDSLFPNIKLPGGISTKATEYKELAAKGDKWESPVFSIGSASQSSNLPSPQQVTRKPHSTAQAGLRGGNTSSSSTGAGPAGSSGGNFSGNVPNTRSGPTGTSTGYDGTSSGFPSTSGTSAPTGTTGTTSTSTGPTGFGGAHYGALPANTQPFLTTGEYPSGNTQSLGSSTNTQGFTAQVEDAFKAPGANGATRSGY